MRSIHLLIVLFVVVPYAQATITAQGDVDPDPTSGNVNGLLTVGEGVFIGTTTIGIMDISGSELNSVDSLVGDRLGSNGFVTVDGLTSIWITSRDVEIGRSGNAELDVTDKGWVGNGDDFFHRILCSWAWCRSRS